MSEFYFQNILKHIRRELRNHYLLRRSMQLFALNAIYLTILIAAESLWYLQPEMKQWLLWPFLLNLWLIHIIWRAMRLANINDPILDNRRLLLAVGKANPAIQDLLLDVYDVSQQPGELSAYAVREFSHKYSEASFSIAPLLSSLKNLAQSAAIAGVALILSLFMIKDGALRLVHFNQSFPPPIHVTFDISPGNLSVLEYDSLTISVKSSDPELLPRLWLQRDTIPEKISPTARKGERFLFQLSNIRQPFDYWVVVSRPHLFTPWCFLSSDTFHISLHRRPQLQKMIFSIQAPDYSGLPTAHFDGSTNLLKGLKGSRLQIEAQLSDPQGGGTILFDEKMHTFKNNEGKLSFSAILNESQELSINFMSRDSVFLHRPLLYALEVTPDLAPTLEVIFPKSKDLVLGSELQISSEIILRDDFGFSGAAIEYSLLKNEYSRPDTTLYRRKLTVERAKALQQIIDLWQIEHFLSPGDAIQFRFVAWDNDAVAGFKKAQSAYFTARIPTITEMFSQANQKEEAIADVFDQNLEETKEAIEALEEIRQEFLKEGELKWESETEMKSILEKQAKMKEALQETQKDLEAHKEFLEENQLFSDETMEKYEKLQSLMDELVQSELFRKMMELQEKLKKGSPEEQLESLEQFQEAQKQFEEALERTLAVFEELMKEERLQEMEAELERFAKQQEKIAEKSETESARQLSKEQQKLNDELENFEQKTEAAAESSKDEAFEKLLNELLQEMDKQGLNQMMEQAEQSFSQNNKESGKQQAQMSKEQLKSLLEKFRQQKEQYMEGKKEAVLDAFHHIFLKTMQGSQWQEELNRLAGGVNAQSPQVAAISSQQFRLLNHALNIQKALYELSLKTFFVNKAIAAEINRSVSLMQGIIASIEDARITMTRRPMEETLASLNRLGLILLKTMEEAEQSGGGGSGMEQMMKQLEQLAAQQQGLNAGTSQQMSLFGKGQGMMEQMGRLAAQQQAIRKSLKELGQEMAASGENPLGNLEQIAKEMEDVINDMRKNNVNRQTIQRQQRILSRMLDATRSVRKREFKEERESKSGEMILRPGPMTLPDDLGNSESLIEELRQELQKSNLTHEEKREMERYLQQVRDRLNGRD
jgi:hypothetical protein